MTRMSGAKALIESLRREHVDVIFGIPGGAIIPVSYTHLTLPTTERV